MGTLNEDLQVDSLALTALLLVDTQNIFYSARALYGNKARIDFLKLKNTAIAGPNISFLKSIAIVADFKREDEVFTGFLSRFGYELQSFEKGSSSEEVVRRVVEKEGIEYDTIIVVSGAGNLVSVYEEIKAFPKTPSVYIRVLSFADSLHKKIHEYVDEVIILDTDVVVKPPSAFGHAEVINFEGDE